MMKKEEILKFYLKFRLYIFPAVVALSFLILIVFVIYPQTVKLIANQRAENDLEEKSKFLEAKAATLESLNEENLSAKLKYALFAYPTDRDFSNVIGLLQKVANQNGLSIASLSVKPGSTDSGSAQKYRVKLELSGRESSFSDFIKVIESHVRIMKVVDIEISQDREGNITSGSLEIEAFYAEAPKSFGSPDSALPQLSSEDEEIIAQITTFYTPASLQPVTAQPRGKADPFE